VCDVDKEMNHRQNPVKNLLNKYISSNPLDSVSQHSAKSEHLNNDHIKHRRPTANWDDEGKSAGGATPTNKKP